MDGIDLTISPSVIAKPCMDCGFCLLICPTGALYTDEKKMELLCKWVSEDMQKWDPPQLAQAEAQGRFRRLVPLEDIGWDTFLWQKKHPRIKIV